MSVWEQFDVPARRSIVGSEEEARVRGSEAIEPVHLAMAVLGADGDPVLAGVLGRVGLTAHGLRAQIDVVAPVVDRPMADRVPFSTDTKAILSRAVALASALRTELIGNDVLLLAVSASGSGPLLEVLQAAGADRDALLRAIRDGGAEAFEVRPTLGLGRFRKARPGGAPSA